MYILHNHTPPMSWSHAHTWTHMCCVHTKLLCEEPTLLSGNNPFFLHVTLVSHQDNLCIVPGVGLDLSGPKEWQRQDHANDTPKTEEDSVELEETNSLPWEYQHPSYCQLIQLRTETDTCPYWLSQMPTPEPWLQTSSASLEPSSNASAYPSSHRAESSF